VKRTGNIAAHSLSKYAAQHALNQTWHDTVLLEQIALEA
jgi:hypothetical protein